jgi:hypothetical protein
MIATGAWLVSMDSNGIDTCSIFATCAPASCRCGQGDPESNGPATIPDMCGSPYQRQGEPGSFVDKYYGPQVTYISGEEIAITIRVTANHGGRFAFSVCPKLPGEVTQACFNESANYLTRADGPYKGKRYYYMSGAEPAGDNENGERIIKWKLPAGVSCPRGCMLQWWWVGYQVRFTIGGWVIA